MNRASERERWPSSPIAWWLNVHVHASMYVSLSLVTDMLCHKRNVFTYTQCRTRCSCICMFCSESNCLLKSCYVSSNPLFDYHQSVCVIARELTCSEWICQTAWFFSTCFKHSLRRLIDNSSLSLFFLLRSLFLLLSFPSFQIILSFCLSTCV